ncbi:hypothetical protein Tsubulata_023841 [Turnera subulata]|uniref:BSD domain-containing protein n=1 Tax=Turnera subulata TaxID=218843 RepID=A0A9Q0G6T7_9ROSI|nr:hypothetical protein Tsubulata_023841 [Turnera subulata]
MDFFKSVFADEPERESRSPSTESEPDDQDPASSSEQQPNPEPTEAAPAGAWSFGGLIRTLTTKSESVIETYRRDLQEFGSGLKKEIEVAQGSLGNVSHAIDELGSSVLKGTAQIISHGKEAILAADQESDSSDNNAASTQRSLGSKQYSRFEAQVRVIQGDPATYCDEAEDVEDYRKWKSGFVVESREELERLLAENGAMESVYEKVVPGNVDEETFWCRYFYKVYKLKQAEEVRASLVKRAISSEDEDLSWDVDDDEGEDESKEKEKEKEKKEEEKEKEVVGSVDSSEESKQNVKNSESEEKGGSESGQIGDAKGEEEVKRVEESSCGNNAVDEKVGLEKNEGEGKVVSKLDGKVGGEGKGDNGGSSKDSEFSVVSSRSASPEVEEEEDLGWDEIEDLSSIDEKKVSHSGGSPNKVDLRKRLSAAEEEEDLSWDIEDDDEPVKS